MNQSEALSILDCDLGEDIYFAYEEKIFEYKQKFLQTIPPIKIMQAIQKKILRLNKALDFFGLKPDNYYTPKPTAELNEKVSILNFLSDYQTNLAVIKLNLANITDGESLISLVDDLINLQKILFFKLSSVLSSSDEILKSISTKISDSIDVYRLQKELKEMNIDEPKLSEYIRKQNNSYWLVAIANANKQIEYHELG
ncbi:MAG: hypothetical protein ACWA41_01725 [Putridiphycobacter sp.]